MAKTQSKASATTNGKQLKNILITQAKPESIKSPYFDLALKHNVELTFKPFIELEPINAREFRKQKIEIPSFSAIIFTSRNAIDHFFRLCDEMKISVSQELKYFCITEAVALYLQKFILYRKRKVFYGGESANKDMLAIIKKHCENETFLYVCSENQQDNEIVNWLKKHNCKFELAFMYRSVSSNVKEIMDNQKFDAICFFTPSGIKALFDNYPSYKQKDMVIGCFGANTLKAAEEAKLTVDIKAPEPGTPSMISGLDKYLGKK